MKKLYLILFTISLNSVVAQRFLKETYSQFDTLKNVQFGQAVNIKGESEKLLLDFYAPLNDDMKKRPLVVFVHGGGYTGGDKGNGYPITFTEGLVKRGFAVGSINYRLGLPEIRNDEIYFEAMYRAAQDTKTAIRYFRKNAKKYGIDKNKIIVMGGSAGAHAILHVAYLDSEEVPDYINTDELGIWKDDKKVFAAINCWGAIVDYQWIEKGDPPLFSMHGEDDPAVPVYYSDSTNGFKYGPRYMKDHMDKLGIYSGTKIFPNTAHTLDNDKNKQREGLRLACEWLYEILD